MRPRVYSSYVIVYLVHVFAANLRETRTAHNRKLHQQAGCQTRTCALNYHSQSMKTGTDASNMTVYTLI